MINCFVYDNAFDIFQNYIPSICFFNIRRKSVNLSYDIAYEMRSRSFRTILFKFETFAKHAYLKRRSWRIHHNRMAQRGSTALPVHLYWGVFKDVEFSCARRGGVSIKRFTSVADLPHRNYAPRSPWFALTYGVCGISFFPLKSCPAIVPGVRTWKVMARNIGRIKESKDIFPDTHCAG